jgi:tetratricopeptide (TPR) repeat protein
MKVNSSAKELFLEGSSALSKGEYDKSVHFFSQALEHDPIFELGYLSRGVAYTKLGKTDLATADFDKAVELNPENPRAHHFRGLAHMLSGEREHAIADFNKAIELNPRYGVAYYSRGTAYSELENAERAGQDMVMAARLAEAKIQGFADEHNIWRTKYDKIEAELMGERERDWAVTPDLRSWLE